MSRFCPDCETIHDGDAHSLTGLKRVRDRQDSAPVAQPDEQQPSKLEDAGSSPAGRAILQEPPLRISDMIPDDVREWMEKHNLRVVAKQDKEKQARYMREYRARCKKSKLRRRRKST